MTTQKKQIRTPEGIELGSAWSGPRNSNRQAVILGHGAGAGMDHEFMSWFHQALADSGMLSVKFNFPYMEAGRRAPDPKARLEAAYRAVLTEVRNHPSGPEQVFIGGKSMGGRIASYLAAEDDGITGLILLGYPLHPPGRPERLRTDHWPKISSPCLFLQGTRDSLCRLDLLKEALKSLGGPVRLQIVDGGDHSFRVLKKSGRSQQEVRTEMLETIIQWTGDLSPGGKRG